MEKKVRIENIIAVVISTAFALVFSILSPNHPWIRRESGADSSVFRTIAFMMDKGYMPYRDTFDFKGPLIYLINYFGYKISYVSGIWCIEIVFLSLTFFVMYKIARLVCSKASSFTVVLAAVSLLGIYFQRGNFTEEYAMLFIAIATYIFLDYFLNCRVNKLRLVLCGLSFGMVFMLRANMIGVWMVFCISIFVMSVLKKNWAELGGFVLWFVAGTVIGILPIIIWLAVKHDLIYFYQIYWIFNFKYSSVRLWDKIESFRFFFSTAVFMIAFLGMLFHIKDRENRSLKITYLVYLIITLILASMSGNKYEHYGMILIPAIVYPISLIMADIESIKDKRTAGVLSMVVTMYIVSMIFYPGWQEAFEKMYPAYVNRHSENRDFIVYSIASIIDSKTEEEDKISVYGYWNAIYVDSRRAHATRYSFLDTISRVNPSITDEYFSQLQEELPKAIVVKRGCYDDRIDDFLVNNGYYLYYAENPDDLSGGACLFFIEE